MKVTTSYGALSTALGVASRAVGKSANVPAVGYVLLDATVDGALLCYGTDIRLRAWAAALGTEIRELGKALLPPKSVADFLDAVIPSEPITVEVDAAHKATLKSGRTVARIAGLDPKQFPTLSLGEAICEISLPAETFRTLVESVAFAALGDDSRPALAGVHIDCDGAYLTLTAADGLRLARRSVGLVDGDGFQMNVPARALSIVAASLKQADGAVHLSGDEQGRTLGIRSAVGCWAIQLLEDRFPDVSRQLAQVPEQTIVVDRDDVLRACRLVSRMTADIIGIDGKTVSKVAKAVLTVDAESLTITAGDTQADHEATVVVEADVDGIESGDDPLVFALNTGALRDAAEALDGPVAIEVCGPVRSVFLRNADGSRAEHCHVVQPMSMSNQSQRS